MKLLKGALSISQLIGMVIGAVILGALIGTVADSTIGITRNTSLTNVTGATYVMVALVPLFLVIFVVVSYISDM